MAEPSDASNTANGADTSDALLSETVGRVAHLTLNRPASRNAMTPELVWALTEGIRRADADPAVKCIVIRGAGEHFCAGGDVKGFHELLATPQDQREDLFERKVLVGDRLPRAALVARKPVVAVVQGAVAGAGVGLALAADYTLCGRSAQFTAAHVHIGLALDCGLGGLLVATVGIKRAMRMALLGERIAADEAMQLGMVSEVVPDDALAARLDAILARLAGGPSAAMAGIKAQLNALAYPDLDGMLAAEARAVGACAKTDDFERGVKALLARQAPKFD